MGTPEFAVASLDALVKAGHNIVGVITAPDKPAGRGMKMNTSAVKKYAAEHSLHVLQPEKLKNPEFLEQLRELGADLQIVVAFRMLPEVVWSMPPMGTVNVHASLLPAYRGAAPINWAIINGETETGVTTFKLTHEIDTGNILLQEKVQIAEDDSAGDLHDKLKEAGARLLLETVSGLADGSIKERPQQGTSATHAPKLSTETARINWSDRAVKIHNLIRGLSPYPGAFTSLRGNVFKIYKSAYTNESTGSQPGEFETDNRKYLRFSASDGYIYAKEIQMEGKKRMSIEEFLRGFR
ncbi:MAG: methionyl-tRNA formyltransferase [Chitinophagaceae bacterium]|nr:methionyl-tRNA formyltransferase [Chitinophagaceae bacterium]